MVAYGVVRIGLINSPDAELVVCTSNAGQQDSARSESLGELIAPVLAGASFQYDVATIIQGSVEANNAGEERGVLHSSK